MPNPLSFFFRFPKTPVVQKEQLNLPSHIAVIMDGNRRWADKKKLPRVAGYKVGLEALKEIYNCCMDLGIKYLTVFAFSTENIGRPKDEVSYLRWLFLEAINKEIAELVKRNVRLKFLGQLDAIEDELKEKIRFAEESTKNNNRLYLQVMYHYGGRAEIVDAVKKIVEKSRENKNIVIDEKLVSDNLYMAGIPDPDLLIRTGGEMRISNFLLWETAYSELYVTDLLFPDFRKEAFLDAIKEYCARSRRCGRI